jgi:transposase
MNADGYGVSAIMRVVGVSKTTVWRWQEYFTEAGVAGLVKGRSKPPGGTARNFVCQAIMMKRKGPSYGYCERVTGPASCGPRSA